VTPDIPAADLARSTNTLAQLEQAFRPFAETLRFDDEPATTFDAAEETE
jgi:hypothetical protein